MLIINFKQMHTLFFMYKSHTKTSKLGSDVDTTSRGQHQEDSSSRIKILIVLSYHGCCGRNIAKTTLTLDCLVTDCKEQVGNKGMDSVVALAKIHT